MNPASLLAQARTEFKNQSPIRTYSPQTKQDIYGFKYLIKGPSTIIQGAIHTEKFLEENAFGRFNGASIILSTSAKLNAGDLIEANDDLYAIAHQKPFNDRMQEYDYVCYSLYDYYKEFIIDLEEQSERILGSDSTRFILALDFGDIPIFPSMFSPNEPKYLKYSPYNSTPIEMPRLDTQNCIAQTKQDQATLLAVGLDTEELQKVLFVLVKSAKDFGLGNIPAWKQEFRYNKEFDLKANIQKCDLMINYTITTTTPQEAEKLIERVSWDFNFN